MPVAFHEVIVDEAGRATGVVLASGERIACATVFSDRLRTSRAAVTR